jgi:DNA-binding MarR family transcriptional regulator
MEENGWVRRRAKSGNERVLVAELTAAGKRLLERARKVAERLDRETWSRLSEREMNVVDSALGRALDVLSSGARPARDGARR